MSGAIPWVERLHAATSELAEKVARAHGDRLRCRAGCSGCCTDELSVFEIEADVIVARHQHLLEHGEPHREGACAFLDPQGRCRIYDARPYVCRTQGLPLRWIEEDDDGGLVEARDICPLNDPGGPPLEELAAEEMWVIGPFEERLADQQRAQDGGEGRRVKLRELFAKAAPAERPAEDGKRKLPVVR